MRKQQKMTLLDKMVGIFNIRKHTLINEKHWLIGEKKICSTR
jgi:hypothetical protein